MFKKIKRINDWAAFKLAAVYGAAITIWVFALYGLAGAFVSTDTQNHMLYWSNAAQLVFCPLMVYVGNQLSKNHKEVQKNHSEHMAKLESIHNSIKEK